MEDPTEYSDKKLLCLAKYYGEETLKWRRRFIGLLPEIYKRKLFEKKGCGSIFEFGKKLAGLSEAQISLAINLEKKFEDKPMLYEALVKGKVSISKLVRVAAIATIENEGLLAQSAEVLSKTSLDVLVRDVKHMNDGVYDEKGGLSSSELRIENGLFEPQNNLKSLPGHTEAKRRYLSEHDEKGTGMNLWDGAENGPKLNFQLSPEVIQKLNALHGKGINVNETILKILEKREKEIATKKETHGEKVLKRELKRKDAGKTPSRDISTVTKRILKEEFGTKCAVNGCEKEATQIHHTVPFSINGSNAPDLLKPLCRAHHDIVHSMNAKYLEKKGMG